MNGEQQQAARSAEHARLAEGSAGAAADWKFIGPYLAERAWGTVREDYSADGDAWRYFPFDRRARAPIAGARTVWLAYATASSACVSRSRFGTGVTPSSRSEFSASVGRREITVRTPRSTGGPSMRRRPPPGCAGAITIRKPSSPMRACGRKTRAAQGTSRNSSLSTPMRSTATGTGRSPRTTPRRRRMMSLFASPRATPGRSRPSCISCRRSGSATDGPGMTAFRDP